VLARKDALAIDLEIVPDHAKANEYGTIFTLRLVVWEGGSVRDIKEQEFVVVTADADDERLPAYFEGLATSIRLSRRIEPPQ
jgi:hypothetical protein